MLEQSWKNILVMKPIFLIFSIINLINSTEQETHKTQRMINGQFKNKKWINRIPLLYKLVKVPSFPWWGEIEQETILNVIGPTDFFLVNSIQFYCDKMKALTIPCIWLYQDGNQKCFLLWSDDCTQSKKLNYFIFLIILLFFYWNISFVIEVVAL